MQALFISATSIKKYGVIEDNVDDKLINQTTLMVQDIHLQTILGTGLYNEISTQINASTLTVLNTTLLDDYIANFLLNAVIAEGCITFNYRFSNKAVITATSEQQYPVGADVLELIRAKWQGQADFYAKRLSDYLCQESASYPLYNTQTNSSDIPSQTPTYKSGFYLGGSRRRKSCSCSNWPYCLCK